MSSSTSAAVAPPATDPSYRRPPEPAGTPLTRSLSASASAVAPDAATASEHAAAAGRCGRRVSVILHGKRADEADVRAAVVTLRSEGLRIDVKVTWESGDVEKFVRDIIKAHSTDTVVAAGGDGTLNEVVAALIKVKAPRHIAVGLMPMGTSNDFAAVTGIPQDLEAALRLCCRSDNLRELDVGLLNGEVFMNTATLGASSELGSETSHEAKKLLGPAAYLVKGVARLATYTAMPVTMRFPAPPEQKHQQHQHQSRSQGPEVTDNIVTTGPTAPEPDASKNDAAGAVSSTGSAAVQAVQPQLVQGLPRTVPSSSSSFHFPRSGERKDEAKAGRGGGRKTVEIHEQVLNLTAGNSRQLASMVQACPDALLDDGLLDITYVTGGPVESATTLVGEILTRGLEGAQPSNVHILRVPWVEVTLETQDPDLAWPGNRDGEPVPPSRKFLLEALPRRIVMHLPDTSKALLTDGADRDNAPVIAIDRMRKGVVRAMVAQVRSFRRIIPGSKPWWQAAAVGLLQRAPILLLAFAAGYNQGRRAERRTSDDGGATTHTGTADMPRSDEDSKNKSKGKGRDIASEGDAMSSNSRGGGEGRCGGGRRSRLGVAILPFWPVRKTSRTDVPGTDMIVG